MVKITISGKHGAGKTTVGKMLAKKFNLKFYSIGDLRGQMALKRGLTINQLNEIGTKKSWTDKEVDDFQKEFGKKEDDLIIEGLLSWYFIPDSIKIFLDVKPDVGAKRIFNDHREDEEKGADWKDQMQKLELRTKNDRKRYLKYYGVIYDDKNQFDLVIDTSDITTEELLDELISKIEKFKGKNVIIKNKKFS